MGIYTTTKRTAKNKNEKINLILILFPFYLVIKCLFQISKLWRIKDWS